MDYRTGLVWQDCQHRTLLGLFDAVAAVGAGPGARADACGEAAPLLARIISFAAGHFEIEEEYMRRLDCADHAEHTREHATFLARLQEIAESSTVADEAMLSEMSRELNLWFRNHILRADQRLASAIKVTCPL